MLHPVKCFVKIGRENFWTTSTYFRGEIFKNKSMRAFKDELEHLLKQHPSLWVCVTIVLLSSRKIKVKWFSSEIKSTVLKTKKKLCRKRSQMKYQLFAWRSAVNVLNSPVIKTNFCYGEMTRELYYNFLNKPNHQHDATDIINIRFSFSQCKGHWWCPSIT